MLMTGNVNQENWSQKNQSVEFHDLFGEVQKVTSQLISKEISKVPAESSEEHDYGLNLIVDSKVLGTIGKVSKKILKHFGIKQDIFYADLDWDLLLKKTNDNIVYQEVSKFPEVRRDLSLVIDKSISFEQIRLLASKTETNLLKELNVFDVYEGNKIDSNKKAYSINFSLQDQNKTLTDKVIEKTMARLMKAFETNLDAIIRQ